MSRSQAGNEFLPDSYISSERREFQLQKFSHFEKVRNLREMKGRNCTVHFPQRTAGKRPQTPLFLTLSSEGGIGGDDRSAFTHRGWDGFDAGLYGFDSRDGYRTDLAVIIRSDRTKII